MSRPAKVIKKTFECQTCGKEFIDYEYYDRKFCSQECKKVYVEPLPSWQLRICLGIGCLGKKEFLSSSKFERVCPDCKDLTMDFPDEFQETNLYNIVSEVI